MGGVQPNYHRDRKSLGQLSCEDAQHRDDWRLKIRGNRDFEIVCVCVCYMVAMLIHSCYYVVWGVFCTLHITPLHNIIQQVQCVKYTLHLLYNVM